MIGVTLIIIHFLRILKKINWNEVLQLNQNSINITFKNYINFVKDLINSHASLKNPTKNKGFKQTMDLERNPNFWFFKKYIKCDDCNKNFFNGEYKEFLTEEI